MDNDEIFKCCNFIFVRIQKEIDKIDSDFYSELMLNSVKYQPLIFFEFKKILLREGDPIIKDEYLYVLKRIIIAFKDLQKFRKVEFDLDSKKAINYTKFYKEIFNIIIYITNLLPVEEYKYDLKTIYPFYLTYKRLQQILPTDIIKDKRENETPITPKEIIELFRCFLLFILSRAFLFIYYNLNEFIQVFLGVEFRHDKYIGLVTQQQYDLLYDLVHKPDIVKLFDNYWYDNEFQDKALYRFKNKNMKDILNFGLFLKEINDNFIMFNESYNIKYCLLYFFLLFNYEDFNFLEDSSNKSNYQNFLIFFLNEIVIEEIFNEENPKALKEMITYKLINFIHGKNYCSFYPTIYFEKFLIDILIKKIKSDKDMSFPKNPLVYYANRLKKYNNIRNIVESFRINWPEKNNLLGLIKEKINNFVNYIKAK